MIPELLIIIIPIVIVIVIFLIYYFNRKQIILRKLSKFKFKPILQFRTNELTKISGKVLYVHEPFEIEKKVRRGKHSQWVTLVEKEDIQDFYIEKGGEAVLVKPTKSPKNYYSYLVEDSGESSGFF